VDAQSTTGVTGITTSGSIGLHGASSNAFGTGVEADGFNGVVGNGSANGVEGFGNNNGVLGESNTYGVQGFTTTGSGVYGHNSGQTGIGVNGSTGGTGSGVYGQATGSGTGVYGDTTDGTGVLAHSTDGTALWVNGAAHFSQSGLAVVPSGSKSVMVTMAGVTAASMILATVQQAGGFYVKYAVPASGSFTIYVNKAPASPTTVKVAYFVLS